MDNGINEVVLQVETYLRETVNFSFKARPTPLEIEFHITELLLKNSLVSKLFSVEVIPINNSYIFRPRNNYTLIIMGAFPIFCNKCGKLLELEKIKEMKENSYIPCVHE